LKFAKVILIISLVSSFYWLNFFIENEYLLSFTAMIIGILVLPAWNLSTGPLPSPLFTFKGFGKKTHILVAMVLIPFLLLIPLGFQPQLSSAFTAWLNLMRQANFSLMSGEHFVDFLNLTGQLALGGFGLLVIIFLIQIFSKRVVDYFHGE